MEEGGEDPMNECIVCGYPAFRPGGHADWCREVAAANAYDTYHCRRGHRWTPETTYQPPHGHRECDICRRTRLEREA